MLKSTKCVVTTSWDDGNSLDLKLADLLCKYNLKGTFYIPKECEYRSLSGTEIKELGSRFEIGAHTLTHPDLTLIEQKRANEEIFQSKRYLEDLLGKRIEMFCYPKGHYNQDIIESLKKSGFIGARTTDNFNFDFPSNPFRIATTIHVYPLKRIEIRGYFDRAKEVHLPFYCYYNWVWLARATFRYVHKKGGVWHLWGHSWEIEKYDMWRMIEHVFKYVTGRKNVSYLMNNELVQKEN